MAIGFIFCLVSFFTGAIVQSRSSDSKLKKEEQNKKDLAFALAVEAMQTDNHILLNTVLTCYSEYLSQSVLNNIEAFILDKKLKTRITDDLSNFDDKLEEATIAAKEKLKA